MVQVDIPAAVAIGQVFGILSKDYLRKEPHLVLNRLLGPFNLYATCGFAPGGLFLLVGWPAWELMYATPWFEAPFDRPVAAGAYVLFAVGLVLLANGGFLLAHHWYRTGKDRLVTYGAIVTAALALLPFALHWGVWLDIGTYADVHAGGGYSFWQPPFFYGWLVIMSFLIGAGVLSGWWFLRTSRRLASTLDAPTQPASGTLPTRDPAMR